MRRTRVAFAALLLWGGFSFSHAGEPIPPAPAEVGPLLEEAVSMQEAGRHDEAIARYEEILKVNPGLPQALAGLAFSAYAKGDWQKTVSIAEQIVATGKDCPAGVYLVIGSAYGMMGLWDKAEEVLLLGQSVWPRDEALRFHRAINVFAQGRVSDAIDHLERCIRNSPYRPEYWRALGDAMSADGARGRAFAAYARSLSLDGNTERSREIAQQMWRMLFEARGTVETKPGDATEEAEAKGLSLVGNLRHDAAWRNRSDAEYFAFALDTMLKLVSALNAEGQRDLFWGPFAIAYFDDLRKAGHMEALAFDIRQAANDPEARAWRARNAEKLARYRTWSERWAVNWSTVAENETRR
ncbi:MAG TPA: tetratricopeptide repeat protein [Candidatus Polarisedimenticolaceae bacterium]